MEDKKKASVVTLTVPEYVDDVLDEEQKRLGMNFTRFVYLCADEYSRFLRDNGMFVHSGKARKRVISNDEEKLREILSRVLGTRENMNLSRFLSDAVSFYVIREKLGCGKPTSAGQSGMKKTKTRKGGHQ